MWGMISSPEKQILLPPVSSCSIPSLFPVRVAWHYLLEQLLWGTRQTLLLPPLPTPVTTPLSHCPAQKRKQLKGNLLDCLCLCHLREGSRAVMIITHCWIITQNLRFTLAYLSGPSERKHTCCHTWQGIRPFILNHIVSVQVIHICCLFFSFPHFLCFSL